MTIITKTNKISILISLAFTFVICATMLLLSCNTSSEKLQDAKEKVNEANEDLSEAQKSYAEDLRLFRIEVGKKITENERKIEEINGKIKNSKNELKAEYAKQVAILEQNNKNLRIKIGAYQTTSKENWEAFKVEFNSDMNKLGNALKNFTVEN